MSYGWAIRAWALLAAVACNGSTPGNGANARSAHKDAGPRWLECTDDARSAMETMQLARLHLAATEERVDGLTCVTIQFARQPAYFIELVGEYEGQRRRLHGVMAMDRTTEVVSLHDAALAWPQLRGAKVWFESVDLDGDGTDELIVHRGDDRLTIAEWVDVVAIRGDKLAELKGPRISYEDPDIDDACRGSVAIERAGVGQHLVVTTAQSNGRSEHCLARGRHVFALVRGSLVEL